MNRFIEKYQKNFLIENDLIELTEVSEKRQEELKKEFNKVPPIREKEFLKDHEVEYDHSTKKFYYKTPLNLSDEELKKIIAMKSLNLISNSNKKLGVIRNILLFFLILTIIIVLPMILSFLIG
ncbi:MAG: hypothetical protein FH761_14695 [Firmicutes bacterium]|nr:hypothetical protein [Bacillota bacterium]